MDEFSIKYELFLAECEMFDSIIDVSSNWILFENVKAELILEGVQDTINRYIDKVTKSIEKAWNKFKRKSNTKQQRQILDQIGNRIEKSNFSFNIKNYPTYDMNLFSSIKVIQFDYTNKDKYINKETYYKSTYPDLYRLDKNITKAIEARVVTKKSNIICGKDKLIETYKFCTKTYDEKSKSIEQDLSIINNSNSIILNMANTVTTPANESIILYKDTRNDIYKVIHEADNDKSMSFTDSDGDTSNSNDTKANNNKNNFINAVKVYMNVSTEILTGKMKILSEAYKTNFDIIMHFSTNKFNKPNTISPTSVKSKVKI